MNEIPDSDLRFREGARSDEAVVFRFFLVAAHLDVDGQRTAPASIDEPLRRYWSGWGRDGDAAVVAESPTQGFAVGCAWARRFTAHEPGFGFVAEDIPELGVGVVAGRRNRGVGTGCLRRLLAMLATSAPGASLSVRPDNPALRLYRRLGFEPVGRDPGGSITMLRRFARPGC